MIHSDTVKIIFLLCELSSLGDADCERSVRPDGKHRQDDYFPTWRHVVLLRNTAKFLTAIPTSSSVFYNKLMPPGNVSSCISSLRRRRSLAFFSQHHLYEWNCCQTANSVSNNFRQRAVGTCFQAATPTWKLNWPSLP